MNFELFIAQRIIADNGYKNSISSPIIKIAITAIALGMVIMMLAVAIGSGFQQKVRDKISGFKGHMQITNIENNNAAVSLVPVAKDQDFYPNFTTVAGIKNVQIFANTAGLIRTESDFEGIVFKGVGADYNWNLFEEYIVEGQLPHFTQERNKEVLLSRTLINRLNLKLNDTISVAFLRANKNALPAQRKYYISGIYDSGFLEFDKNMMIGDIREVQKIKGWQENEVGGFEVIIDDFELIERKGKEVYNHIPSYLNSQTILELYPRVFEWIKLADNNVWFIIFIMILVAGINMITALLVLILERIPMIGILKALGSNNWSIRKIFLYNAAYLILKGLFWGNLIGFSMLFMQQYFGIIALNPETYYVTIMPVNIDFFQILLLNLGTLLLCFVMLLVPSFIITKIQPSQSIKFA